MSGIWRADHDGGAGYRRNTGEELRHLERNPVTALEPERVLNEQCAVGGVLRHVHGGVVRRRVLQRHRLILTTAQESERGECRNGARRHRENRLGRRQQRARADSGDEAALIYA